METKQQFLEEINKVKGSKRDYLNKLFQYVSEAVIRAAVHKNVKKDEFIIRAGEPCDTVYIILKGDVAGVDYQKLGKVYYFMDFAKMYIVGDFEIFSEDTNYNVSICASKDSELLAIPASIYWKWIKHDENALLLRIKNIMTILTSEKASACIPAAYVKQAAEYVEGKLPICTVIGFPNGYHTTAVKVFETKNAIANGSSEIDMVINIGFLKDGRYEEVEKEIRQIHEACDGKILKVIIETCLLTEEEKIKACEIVTNAGAEFIKTSTGFSTAGATFDDVALMKEHVGENVKIKAAGGISSFDDAEKFISLGASRLGTSRLIKIMKNTDNGAGY